MSASIHANAYIESLGKRKGWGLGKGRKDPFSKGFFLPFPSRRRHRLTLAIHEDYAAFRAAVDDVPNFFFRYL